jgi:hypothetical protein
MGFGKRVDDADGMAVLHAGCSRLLSSARCSVCWQRRISLPLYISWVRRSRLNPQKSGRAVQASCGPFRIPWLAVMLSRCS